MTKALLIVEDDPGLQSQMRWCFNDDVEVHMASDRESAISSLRRHEPKVVTLDLGLPPDPGGSAEGFKILEEILQLAPATKVIVITGREENENAVRAIGMGATDFFQKPLDAEILNFIVERAFKVAQLETENVKLKFTDDGIDMLAKISAEVNSSVENIGARRLHTIIEKVLDDISFNATDRAGETITVDQKYVQDNLGNLVKDTDLSKFIL